MRLPPRMRGPEAPGPAAKEKKKRGNVHNVVLFWVGAALTSLTRAGPSPAGPRRPDSRPMSVGESATLANGGIPLGVRAGPIRPRRCPPATPSDRRDLRARDTREEREGETSGINSVACKIFCERRDNRRGDPLSFAQSRDEAKRTKGDGSG